MWTPRRIMTQAGDGAGPLLAPRSAPWRASRIGRRMALVLRRRAAKSHALESHVDSVRRVTAMNAVLFIALVLTLAIGGLLGIRDFRSAAHTDVWRGAWARAFETHYDDAFPVRKFGVNLWAAIDYTLFKEGLPGVIVGKDGWLYTDEEFKLDNDSPSTVEQNLALIDWVKGELAKHDVALLVAVVPAKARVYPEHLDGRLPPELRRTLYAHALDELNAESVAYVPLLRPLLAGKEQQPTFLRTDTHWTPYGAQIAAQAVAAHAGNLIKAGGTFRTQADGTHIHRGDLFNFLPLDPWFARLLPPPDVIKTAHTVADDDVGDLLGAQSAAEVALVGTSYSAEKDWNFVGALEQALHADVLNYAKDGQGPFQPMLAYLNSADFRASPPKLVIWEVPERYLTLPQTALAPYHLPPDALTHRAAEPAAERGLQAREGGSPSHVTSKL